MVSEVSGSDNIYESITTSNERETNIKKRYSAPQSSLSSLLNSFLKGIYHHQYLRILLLPRIRPQSVLNYLTLCKALVQPSFSCEYSVA